MRVILALVLAGLLVAPIAVQADLFVTDVVYAGDSASDYFRNSLVRIPWDGSWVPFITELRFDDDMWDASPDPAICGYDPIAGTGGTQWAGNMYYGLYHTDLDGAPGFQETRKWSLISCDRNGDRSGSFDGADRELPPSPFDRGEYRETLDPPGDPPYEPYTECKPASEGGTYCIVEIADKDKETDCTTGNCLNEIVTTIRVNLDLDCNGEVDPESGIPALPIEQGGDPIMLCFFAEARTPWPDQVATNGLWKGPIQARISDAGGDKTVSFKLISITAVELAAFDAAAQDNGVLLTWETATELDNLGFNIYRADSQIGEMNKINASLIPSKDPGGTVGAAYSFLDESAVPGATYYYWLEDVDVSGAAEMNGPVVANMGTARALPGRPRPAPMPSNAF